MGIRNKKRETLRRLDSKTLDAKFLHEIQHGLNCSPVESEAVLEVVKEVYFPFFDEQEHGYYLMFLSSCPSLGLKAKNLLAWDEVTSKVNIGLNRCAVGS